jgi:hypothetical protein
VRGEPRTRPLQPNLASGLSRERVEGRLGLALRRLVSRHMGLRLVLVRFRFLFFLISFLSLQKTGDGSLSLQIRRAEGVVLCIPGRGLLDEALAMPLAQLLRREGLSAEAKEADTLSISKLFALEIKGVALICLCFLDHVAGPIGLPVN